MDKIFNAISVMTGVLGGLAASLFGAWDKSMQTLIMLIVLDYATGLIKGAYTKKLSSDIGFKGLLKKIVILVVVGVSHAIQELTGNNIAVREVVIMFYIANEGLSILENAAVLSPNMPEKLKEILLQLRGDDNENRN